jgi:hypothetical protein
VSYESPESRRAYIAGVRATFDSVALTVDPREARAVEEWINVDLANWTSGEPPPAPVKWFESTN